LVVLVCGHFPPEFHIFLDVSVYEGTRWFQMLSVRRF